MLSILKKLFLGTEERQFGIKFGLAKGLKFYLDPKSQAQIMFGLDEIEIARFFRKFISKSKTFVDVGSSFGYYTITAASMNKDLRVIGFDCLNSEKVKFENNFSINNIIDKNRVKYSNSFIGTKHKRLDDLLLDCEEPILCKIDVEGNELDVLQSGKNFFLKNNLMIILETHSFELEQSCKDFLSKSGFNVEIVGNAWWRSIISDGRILDHNKWIIAEKI